jgi:hypothetical protein
MQRVAEMISQKFVHPKVKLVFKIVLLLVLIFLSLRFCELFLIYSAQAGSLAGHSGRQAQYDSARTWQLLSIMGSIVFQLLGGNVLRALIGSDAIDWYERIKSVFLFTLGFFVMTGFIGAILVYLFR